MSTLRSLLVSAALGTSAIIASPALTLAADLPPPPPPPMRAATFDWSGAYVGALIGVGSVDNRYVPIGAPDPELSGSGLVAGGMVGYNYQMGNYVIGIEGDGMFTDIKPRNTSDGVDQKFGSLFTLRTRFGFAHDNTLFYATGGLGFLRSRLHIMPADETLTKTHIGVVAGGGIEHGFSPNMLARAEYLYGHFQKKNYVYTPGTVRMGVDDLHMFRAGLAYKF